MSHPQAEYTADFMLEGARKIGRNRWPMAGNWDAQRDENIERMWVFPKKGVPQNGWFIREHPIRIDDLGVPLFLEPPMCI